MIQSILKKFLKGLLYIFILPGVLVILSFYSVIGIFMFVFLGIKAILLFFTGRNLFGDLPEDIKARQILTGQKQEYVLETNTSNIPVQGEELVIGNNTPIEPTIPETTLPPENTPQSTLPPVTEDNSSTTTEHNNDGLGGEY